MCLLLLTCWSLFSSLPGCCCCCCCREYARVTPKVKDIIFVATLKIMLKPLVEQIPGFGESFAITYCATAKHLLVQLDSHANNVS